MYKNDLDQLSSECQTIKEEYAKTKTEVVRLKREN